MNEDPTSDIKKEDLLKPLEGSKREEYQSLEDGLSIKQCQMSLATMKGFLTKKKVDLRRIYKNSQEELKKAKYQAWQNEVQQLEQECTRWQLVIDKKKQETEDRKNEKIKQEQKETTRTTEI